MVRPEGLLSNLNPTLSDIAPVITDLQNNFLSPDGVIWGLTGENAIVTTKEAVASLN